MSTIALLVITGLGLGSLYFLVASGLSLIWGLMRVLNFAHGAIFTVAAYAGWVVASNAGSDAGVAWAAGLIAATLCGGALAFLLEVLLIRPLYARPIGQVLVTVGAALALVALMIGIFGGTAVQLNMPTWMSNTTTILGASIPNTNLFSTAVALVVLALLLVFLRRTRYGLIVRAGVENRSMVQALGIDVGRAFTIVFTIGGIAAGLAGYLAATYFGFIDPERGTSMLIFAFIVVVVGRLGSMSGTAIAAAGVALLQQFLNFYSAPGVGDFSVVLLLALALLLRPQRAYES
ncbi:MAG TPA: branched-chain amino acid ABC transporter permease [Candidatus Baltobacteraceae bacterium]|nr:branched-chain amino acid ABC transporter permease [Candidatus Baltobacteraceae bacterium]